MKPISTGKKIAFSILILFIFLFSLEKLSQYIDRTIPPMQVDTDGGFSEASRAFKMTPEGTLELNPNKSYSLHLQKFDMAKKANTIRIALLGESSVFNLFPYQELLKQKLKARLKNKKEVEILNFGANSYGSTRLTILAKELATYSPDFVFIYMGHNEFEELEQLDLISPGRAYIANTIYRSAFARLMSRALLSISVTNLKKEREERFFSSFPNVYPARYHTFTKLEISERMEKFNENLEKIISILKGQKARVVISTVPSNLMAPLLRYDSINEFVPFFNLYTNHEYKAAYELSKKVLSKTTGRHQSTDEENSIIKNVAIKFQIPLVDFEKTIIEKEPNHIPGETLFLDHCHLNVQGNLYLIEAIANSLAASE